MWSFAMFEVDSVLLIYFWMKPDAHLQSHRIICCEHLKSYLKNLFCVISLLSPTPRDRRLDYERVPLWSPSLY